MAEEKKSRQRLTMTAMYEAINDLFFACLPEPERENYRECQVLTMKTREGIYRASLFKQHIEIDAESEHEEDGESGLGLEEATAALLEKMKGRFDMKRKSLLQEMDTVLDRHHGALRGARSKIREKKA